MISDVPKLLWKFLKQNPSPLSDDAKKLMRKGDTNVCILEDYLKERNETSQNKGWSRQEDLILEQCVRWAGMGKWSMITSFRYLLGKNKALLVRRVKKFLGTRKIGRLNEKKAKFADISASDRKDAIPETNTSLLYPEEFAEHERVRIGQIVSYIRLIEERKANMGILKGSRVFLSIGGKKGRSRVRAKLYSGATRS